MSPLHDHIYVILLAFLAVLGCFTAVAMVGVDATIVGTLRDVLLALGGALGTAYVAARKSASQPTVEEAYEDAPAS